jgi:hypothetical protein
VLLVVVSIGFSYSEGVYYIGTVKGGRRCNFAEEALTVILPKSRGELGARSWVQESKVFKSGILYRYEEWKPVSLVCSGVAMRHINA